MNLKNSPLFNEYAENVEIKRNETILFPSIKVLIQPVEGKFDIYQGHVVYIDENKNIEKGDIITRENGDQLSIKRVSTYPNIDFALLDLVDL